MAECGSCRAVLQEDWFVCPYCGLRLRCPACRKSVAHSDQSANRRPHTPTSHHTPLPVALREMPPELHTEILMAAIPFYERLPERLGLTRFSFSVLLGVLMIISHAALASRLGESVLPNWSWMLGVITGTAAFFVLWATSDLRNFGIRFYASLKLDEQGYRETIGRILVRTLSNRYMVWFGCFFAAVNTCFGLYWGLPFHRPLLWISMIVQLLAAGFVCGIAIGGYRREPAPPAGAGFARRRSLRRHGFHRCDHGQVCPHQSLRGASDRGVHL
jgi:hypothetical protein